MGKYLVDSHCHLNYPGLHENVDEVLAEADSNGVKIIQTICTQMSEVNLLKKISNSYSNVFYSVGVHPLHAHENLIIETDVLIDLVRSDKRITGIGETGLDYYKESDEIVLEIQKKSFENHIAAAQVTGVPLIIHTRDAESDTYDLIFNEIQKSHFSGVLHCFTGSMDLAIGASALGLYVSASGIITFKNANEIREVFKNLPLDKILIETDAPFLAPVPYRGKMNRPSYVVEVAKCIASIRGISYDEVVSATTRNFHELFKRSKEL